MSKKIPRNPDFGKKLKEIRLSRGMTQKTLGQKVDVSDVFIAYWETGKEMPRMERVESLVKALQATDEEAVLLVELATRPAPREEFWDRVKDLPNGCREWQKCRDGNGYGLVRREGTLRRAHIVAWLLVKGFVPEGMCVLHKCDNPPCCNPDHLFLGTRADNAHDRDKKGRQVTPRGLRSPRAKLSEIQVREIRATRKEGGLLLPLSQQFGVAFSTVYEAAIGRSYRWVK